MISSEFEFSLGKSNNDLTTTNHLTNKSNHLQILLNGYANTSYEARRFTQKEFTFSQIFFLRKTLLNNLWNVSIEVLFDLKSKAWKMVRSLWSKIKNKTNLYIYTYILYICIYTYIYTCKYMRERERENIMSAYWYKNYLLNF